MMLYAPVDVNLREHPKSMRLAVILGDPRAWSYAVALWLWAGKFARDGAITIPDEAVEASLGYDGHPGTLMDALRTSGFIDADTNTIHDWAEGAGRYFARKAADAERKRRDRASARDDSDDVRRTSTDVRGQSGARPARGAPYREEKRREDNNPPTPQGGFDVWWDAYPKKVGKGAARKAWDRAKRPDTATLLEALGWQRTSEAWRKDGGQYVPNPATYLNQERWADEPPKPARRESGPRMCRKCGGHPCACPPPGMVSVRSIVQQLADAKSTDEETTT